MSTSKNIQPEPELVFGPSSTGDGFKVLHRHENVNSDQSSIFDSACRRFSWSATAKPPEDLHALVTLSAADTLFLLHVRQQVDDKQRRAIRIEAYLFSPFQKDEIIDLVKLLANAHNIMLLKEVKEKIIPHDGFEVLSENDSLELTGMSSPTVPIPKSPKLTNTPKPRKPSNRPPPQSNKRSMFKVIVSLAVGLLIGTAGIFFVLTKPQMAKIELLKGELSSMRDQVQSLNEELEVKAESIARLEDDYESANVTIKDLKDNITTLRIEMTPEDLIFRELLDTTQKRSKLAESVKEDMNTLRDLAKKLQKTAEKLEEKSSWKNLPKSVREE